MRSNVRQFSASCSLDMYSWVSGSRLGAGKGVWRPGDRRQEPCHLVGLGGGWQRKAKSWPRQSVWIDVQGLRCLSCQGSHGSEARTDRGALSALDVEEQGVCCLQPACMPRIPHGTPLHRCTPAADAGPRGRCMPVAPRAATHASPGARRQPSHRLGRSPALALALRVGLAFLGHDGPELLPFAGQVRCGVLVKLHPNLHHRKCRLTR